MKKYFENLIRILDDSLRSVDEDAFENLITQCTNTIKSGHKIIVSGLGKNVPVCEKFVGTMNSFGFNTCYMNTNSAVHGDIGVVHELDLVIILTKSGETAESVYLYSLLQKRHCTIWLLSFERNSTLAKAIPNSIIMRLEHEGDQWNIAPNNSTILNLIILQLLATRLSITLNVKLEDFKENHPGGHIGEILKNE